MTKFPTVARAVAFIGLAAMLAGCKTASTDNDITAGIPNDYRQRHPIAVREAAKTLTVFIGDRRSGLTATQRGEVGALASQWRREATGGVVIEVPVGPMPSPWKFILAPRVRGRAPDTPGLGPAGPTP